MRRILLVRHGQSEGNIDESKYLSVGDPLIELTDLGWNQALNAGKFLEYYYRNNPPEQGCEPVIWSSTFMRTRQTTQGVLTGLGWQDRPVREDLRLVEQSYGMNAWVHGPDSKDKSLVERFMKISQHVFHKSRYLTPLPAGESLMDQFMRVDSFLGTLHRDEERHGHDDLLIISHGATIKNFLMRWFHIPDYQWKQLETPHNCDVIELTHNGSSWQARKLYDGESRHIALRYPLGNIKPAPLPAFPDLKP